MPSDSASAFLCPAVLLLALAPAAHGGTHIYSGKGGVIPDDAQVTSTIVIPDDLTIVDVTVTIEGLSHSFAGQLEGTLSRPGADPIEFFSHPGDLDDSNFGGDYLFNDAYDGGDMWAVAASLGDGDTIPGGAYFPFESEQHRSSLLSGILGASAAGEWVLTIEDTVPGAFAGAFSGWKITIEAAGPPAPVLYVDDSAPAGGDGLSWSTAYHHPRSALVLAAASPVVEEIRIGRGTYKPTIRTDAPDPRSSSFVVPDGVELLGGFAGFNAPNPDLRNPSLFIVTLEGDRFGNDVPGSDIIHPSRDDNAWHVLTLSGTSMATLVDGFTVRGGVTEAGGPTKDPTTIGGGLYNDGGSPRVTRCRFEGNLAVNGGAVGNVFGAAPEFSECRFVGNVARGGGAVCSHTDCEPLFIGCVFEQNHATDRGGAIESLFSSLSVRFSTFKDNSAADDGGAIAALQGPTLLVESCHFETNQAEMFAGGIFTSLMESTGVTGCVFVDNYSGEYAGAAFGYGPAVYSNCLFDGNSARTGGAVMVGNTTLLNCRLMDSMAYELGGAAAVVADSVFANCLIAGSTALDGGAALYVEDAAATLVNCTLVQSSGGIPGRMLYVENQGSATLRSCIGWISGPSVFVEPGSSVSIAYSNVMGGWSGTGNISDDPLFVDPLGPDGVASTVADNDYRLSPGSPCVDAGDNAALPPDTVDLDSDGDVAEPLPLDLALQPRRVDDPWITDTGAGAPPIIDMGAWERQPVACFADTNGDERVDVDDLVNVMLAWGPCTGCPEDLVANDAVDINDLLVVILTWGECQ